MTSYIQAQNLRKNTVLHLSKYGTSDFVLSQAIIQGQLEICNIFEK